VGNLRERDQFVDPALDGRIILKMDLHGLGCGDIGWIYLAEDRDR
jgi:hypothetical protein